MAWVSVPDLAVAAARQTYTHLSAAPAGGGLVRFASGTFPPTSPSTPRAW